jgi:osmotically-inducible protein OsmY
VLMNDTTAILRGTVESQKAAELLEQILLFEPGIEQIVNQLQVRKTF